MMQPPGGTGVQGLRYSKLFPYTESQGWELHFAGPAPQLASVGLEPLGCPTERCHYTKKISFSHQLSILKNRQRRHGLLFFFYGLLQFAAKAIEVLRKHDRLLYLESGLHETVIQADKRYHFDLIAAISPDFRILEIGADIAQQLSKPLLAIYHDPHGQRDEVKFYPDDRERQLRVLSQAAGVLFMSPLTRDRYVDQNLVERSKTFCLTDSYPLDQRYYDHIQSCLPREEPPQHRSTLAPEASTPLQMVHLGSLPEWRPIDPLLAALTSLEKMPDAPQLSIDLYGYLYPKAHDLIDRLNLQSDRYRFRLHNSLDHLGSHWVAANADILLVMIGGRHLDNQPSKFFVYLGHKRPVLVIGPLGNPIEKIINDTGIGVYADVRDVNSIRRGMLELINNFGAYQEAFDRQYHELRRYAADRVALSLINVYDETLKRSRKFDSSQPGIFTSSPPVHFDQGLPPAPEKRGLL